VVIWPMKRYFMLQNQNIVAVFPEILDLRTCSK
jgi:hypothetical protein